MVSIKKQLVAVRSLTSGVGNPCNYITIHETANTVKGANAQSHANLQSKGNSRLASWHYQVDDKEIIQSFLDNVQCWHAGDGQGKGNMESIAIEICVNSDGNFKKAVKNAAELVKYLVKQHSIPIGNVVQHNRWSGKDCPQNLRHGSKGIDWNDFIGLVKGSTGVHVPTQEVGSVVVTKPSSTEYKGNSIVDYLNSKGIDSSTTNRKKLAKEYGISGYDLSIAKNLELLNAMRNGKKPATSTPTPSPEKPKTNEYKGNSIVDYLNSKKIDASFANRKKLANQYGIKNYTGTSAQNTQLLNKMRNGAAPKPTSKPKGDQKTSSIVDYLNSIKVDASFANRKKLAAKYGIKNYTGTASQNNQLLKKMRG